MSAVDALVFDLGNVVIEWSPLRLYRKLLPDDEQLDAFLREVDIHALNAELDLGRDPEPTVAEWAARHPRWQAEISVYWDRWPETLGAVDEATVALIDELKAAGRRVFALSNWGAKSFRRKQHHRVFDEFDGVIISGEVGVNKPDPKIYELAEAEFRLVPPSTLFIDDRAENVAAAESRGWMGHEFSSAARLRSHLSDLGAL